MSAGSCGKAWLRVYFRIEQDLLWCKIMDKIAFFPRTMEQSVEMAEDFESVPLSGSMLSLRVYNGEDQR
jgi:hypothetical protein